MKKPFKILLIAILSVTVWITGCSQNKNKISANEFENQIKKRGDEQVVDVRTPEEFQKGHIDGAFNVNFNGPEFVRQVSALDKSKPVFVYCLSGGRSAKAAAYMRKEGFTEVVELDGGLMKWNSEKRPVVSQQPTPPGMSAKEFKHVTKSDKLVLVDFHAPWCAPCIKMAPELQSLQDAHSDELVLLKINVDENKTLTDSLKIDAIPVLMLFKNGEKVWSNSGLIGKEQVREQIEKNL
jgi:thioredoxin 1